MILHQMTRIFISNISPTLSPPHPPPRASSIKSKNSKIFKEQKSAVRFQEETVIIPIPPRPVHERILTPIRSKFVNCFELTCYYLCFPCIGIFNCCCKCNITKPNKDKLDGHVMIESSSPIPLTSTASRSKTKIDFYMLHPT